MPSFDVEGLFHDTWKPIYRNLSINAAKRMLEAVIVSPGIRSPLVPRDVRLKKNETSDPAPVA